MKKIIMLLLWGWQSLPLFAQTSTTVRIPEAVTITDAAFLNDQRLTFVDKSRLQMELKEYDQYLAAGTTVDTSLLPARVKSFILIHPDYWISLLQFGRLVQAGLVTKPGNKFEAFPPAMQHSPLGRSVHQLILDDEATLGPGKMAPDFTASTPDGKPIRLSDLHGKYILLDFWASWCGPCRMENPNVLANYKRYREKNFVVLSFSLDENKTAWQQAIDADHLDWYHAGDGKGWHSTIVQLYKVPSVPKSFLIDPDGKIIAVDLRGDDLRRTLEKTIK